MIQRVQSVYLLTVLIVGALLFFVPLSMFVDESAPESAFFMELTRVYMFQGDDVKILERPLLPLLLNALTGIIALISLFMFRRLDLQMKLIRFGMIVVTLFLLSLFYYFEYLSKLELGAGMSVYQYGSYLPMLQIIFFFLALRGIRRDRALLKSAERLR